MRVFKRDDFTWRELALCISGRKPMLTLVADATYSHLFRIRYPNGWTTPPANITRAKDAAYGHARHLLGEQRPVEAPHSAESALQVSRGAR